MATMLRVVCLLLPYSASILQALPTPGEQSENYYTPGVVTAPLVDISPDGQVDVITGPTIVTASLVDVEPYGDVTSNKGKRSQELLYPSATPAGSSYSNVKLERARPESEGQSILDQKPLSKVQMVLLKFINPVPIVDNIKEEDKYGNTGAKFNRIGRGFVDGVSAITSFFSTAADDAQCDAEAVVAWVSSAPTFGTAEDETAHPGPPLVMWSGHRTYMCGLTSCGGQCRRATSMK
uniref:Uncharacterized protein n=1 Tax=Timema bartmani TaxID=61472 RepID=A0A7R9HZH7_9NEOP|nr:unnamed protein product [Timema bartmani]